MSSFHKVIILKNASNWCSEKMKPLVSDGFTGVFPSMFNKNKLTVL